MNAAPLVFRGRTTEADVADMWRCYNRALIRPSTLWFGRALATLFAAVLIWLLLRYGAEMTIVSALFACVHIPFIEPYRRVWLARRHYRRHAEDFGEAEVRLSQVQLSITTDVSYSEFPWRFVGSVTESRLGMLFCNRANEPLLWLPDRMLEGIALREQVLELAAGNGIEVKTV